MKKMSVISTLLSMILIFAVLTSCNSNRNTPPLTSEETSATENSGSESESSPSEEQPHEPVKLEDLPEDTILIFQSKTKQLNGRIVDGTIKVPFFEFVDDMGYAYDENEDDNTITIHNSDLGVSHVVEIGSNVVLTGDEQTTMLSTLDYFTVEGQEVLFVPTSLYSVFDPSN